MYNYGDTIYVKDVRWREKRSWWFHLCIYSSRIIWPGEKAMYGERFVLTIPFKEVSWVNHNEFIIRRLKGEL